MLNKNVADEMSSEMASAGDGFGKPPNLNSDIFSSLFDGLVELG